MAMTIELLVDRLELLEKRFAQLNTDNSKMKRTSGYLMHNMANRDDVKARLEANNDEKVKVTEVTKELAIMWKALSDDERENWNNKAKANTEEQNHANPNFANNVQVQEQEAELEAEHA